jgi:hypothetical protein
LVWRSLSQIKKIYKTLLFCNICLSKCPFHIVGVICFYLLKLTNLLSFGFCKQKPESWRLACQTIVGNKENSGKVSLLDIFWNKNCAISHFYSFYGTLKSLTLLENHFINTARLSTFRCLLTKNKLWGLRHDSVENTSAKRCLRFEVGTLTLEWGRRMVTDILFSPYAST